MRFLVLIALLVPAACQPLPHPFADQAGLPSTPALSPPDSAGILVLPVSGAPDAAAHALAEAMAQALRAAEVPASTGGGNRGSYRLAGTAQTQPVIPGRIAVNIAWELRDARGESLGTAQAKPVEVADAAWRAGDPALAATISAEAAPQLAKLADGNPPLPAPVAEPVVAIGAVSGAPGDGGVALPRAMSNALRTAHLQVADAPGPDAAYTVTGQVEVTPAEGGRQEVKLHWVLAGADGAEIGRIDQQNAIATGSLEPYWGDTAFAAASAAAPGILQLIERARAEAAGG